MTRLPQVLRNVRVANRDALSDAARVWEAVAAESAGLEGRGRVLVRPSGTEPVVRVMAEAPEEEECEAVVARLAGVVSDELGPPPPGS
jgi:phosphoglucosamine mutase